MKISDKLKFVKLSDITPYFKNAKKHSQAHIDFTKKSLKENDYYNPIGVDKDNIIVVGHKRFQALLQNNVKKVEVIDFSYLKPKQIKKLRLKDNKGITDKWDMDLVQNELEEMYKDIQDAKELGFTQKELDAMLKLDDDKVEVPFTEELLESHNYIVLYFDNDLDWLNAQTIFELKTVKALDSKKGFEKKGIGRVINGTKALNKIIK